jgi:hypothetical protein
VYRLVVLSLLLVGCAHLKVDVAIFDSRYEESLEFLEAAARTSSTRVGGLLASGRLVSLRVDLEGKTQRFVDDLSRVRVIPDELRTEFSRDLRAAIAASFQKAEGFYKGGLTALTESRTVARNDDRRRVSLATAVESFRQGDQELATIPIALSNLALNVSRTAGISDPGFLAQRISQFSQDASRRLASLIGDAGIFDDPHAPMVVTAPDAAWRGLFNQTYATGVLGNTDMAIKMESLGNLTLKGVRLDAAKITQAVFDAAGQAVKLVAVAYGVPVGALQSDGKTAPTEPGADIIIADQSRREAEVEVLKRRIAAVAIMDAILSERRALEANESGAEESKDADAEIKRQRGVAVGRIKAVFAANKGQLGD